ncbi:MAG: STAS domain-containing protein [Hamadaea sp.]|nr:STAS domain-containing protein [Hamadaea sp.]
MATHTARVSGDTYVVALSGEIDMSNSDELEGWLREAVSASGRRRIVVDLSALEFLDSFGIRALLRGKEHADAHEAVFTVTNPNGLVERILRTLGLFEHLTHP